MNSVYRCIPSVDGGFEIYHTGKYSWTWETTDCGAGGCKGAHIAAGEAEPGVPPTAPPYFLPGTPKGYVTPEKSGHVELKRGPLKLPCARETRPPHSC